jgi:D-alanyl-lipoteichoic acid acyltransferase DltB (MBOAT superfamily)
MSFVSTEFLLLLVGTIALYYLVPKRAQWVVLLAASYVFYLFGGLKTVGYLLLTTLSTWAAGLLLERLNARRAKAPKEQAAKIKRQKKAVVAVALTLNFGMLFLLKYLDFTLQTAASALGRFGVLWQPESVELVLPLGVSFFVFQSTGYVIDQYRGKYPAQRNPIKFALFTSFFPQMVQGPISRYDQLAPQLLAERQFSFESLRSGIQLMLWGYLKKMVIADRAAVLVNGFFADYNGYGGAVAAFSILMYCINLYCDFSGGIDITRGAAACLGIDMEENFRRPIFATSLSEYWRRWHITLGGWMRDYVFYPLSLSKPFGRLGKWSRKHIGGKLGKILPTSLATFVVYLIIGIWHGANFRFIAYGFWNGAIITSSLLLANRYHAAREKLHIRQESGAWKLFQMLRTSVIVFLGRYITRAPRLLVAIQLVVRTLNPKTIHLHELWSGALLQFGLTGSDMAVIFCCTAAMLCVEAYQEKRGSVREALAQKNALVQWLAMLIPMVVLLLLGLMRGSYISSEFIYRQY